MAAYSTGAHGHPSSLAQADQMTHEAGYGPGPASSNGSKSPLSMDLFKNLTTEKKQTKDGHTPKRRGPKPDSKPALTRRQELNRQAQRTHRERKELYIKALEQEVLRLKEHFAQNNSEREAVVEENRRLKELLVRHGISYDFAAAPITFQRQNSSYGPSSSGSVSGSYRGTSDGTGFSSPPPNASLSRPQAPNVSAVEANHSRSLGQIPSNRLDYDQIGIDFVLTYDSHGNPLNIPAPYPSPPPQG